MTIERCDSNSTKVGERLDDKLSYQAPEFSVTALRLVTLGGTIGNDDSGSPNSQQPPGGASGAGFEDQDLNPMPKDPDR